MGQHLSLIDQWFPPRSKFSVEDIPDLSGRVALVTGGNTGIGKETVRQLLAHGAKVYLAARSPAKAQSAIEDLERDTGKRAIFLECDLADLAKTRKAAETFLSQEKELHMLFCNGGVMWPNKDQLTADGLDLQWGTNVVGHFLLTKGLLPALLAGVHSSPDGKARVVITSSMAAYLNTIHWGSFRPGPEREKMSTFELYDQSKHANVVFARELGRRYGDQGLVVTACNPGNLRTDLQRNIPWIGKVFMNFLIPWARVGECRPEANDPDIGRRLWEYLEDETKVAA
ncbi:NAD-P-binding protein [Amylostereum chailletii]|nr:NAD-P-binding protein [Amylostereum chailletii]